MKKWLNILTVGMLVSTSVPSANMVINENVNYKLKNLKEQNNTKNLYDHIIYIPGTNKIIYSDDIKLLCYDKNRPSYNRWGSNFVLLINSKTSRIFKDLKIENVRDVLVIIINIFGGCLNVDNLNKKININNMEYYPIGLLNKLEALIAKFWFSQNLFINNVKTYNFYDDIGLAVSDNYNTGDIDLGNFELNIIFGKNLEYYIYK